MSDQKLDVETLLAELKQERAELDITIAKLEAKLSNVRTEVDLPENNGSGAIVTTIKEPTSESPDLRSDTFFRMSMPAAAKKYLNMVRRPADTNEIADALKKGGILTQAKNFLVVVHSGLARDKAFTRVKKKWGLAEWYPSLPKSATTKKKRKTSKRKTKKRTKKMAKPSTGDQDSSDD